jgi:hypothetical protein
MLNSFSLFQTHSIVRPNDASAPSAVSSAHGDLSEALPEARVDVPSGMNHLQERNAADIEKGMGELGANGRPSFTPCTTLVLH